MFHHLFFTFLIVTFILPNQGKAQYIPEFVNSVYDNLYTVANNSPIGKPKLIYDTKNDKQIVTYRSGRLDGTTGEIIVGHRFLTLMRTFGKDSSNALAFVLGHEMAHVLLKQTDHIESLGSGYADRSLRKSLKVIKDSLYTNVFERQADEHAAFYAHMAGYNTTEIGSAVLDAIYKEFNLPDNLRGYPVLKERKLIAQAAGNRMKILAKIYDAANLSIAGGKYKMAKRLYDIILTEGFESNDIYNNCGVAQTMLAIENDTTLQKYVLPLFLDTESALDEKKLHRGIYDDSKSLLEAAREYFDKAANRNYPIATLNLGIVAFLLDDLEEATYMAKKAQKLNLVQAETLLGIISHAEGESNKAKQIWKSVESDCPIAKRNLNLLFPKYACFLSKNSNEDVAQLNDLKVDLVSPFFNKNYNARDSDTLFKILKTQVLQYYNTTIDDRSFSRFKIKGGESDEIVHVAELWNINLSMKEDKLVSQADRILLSNRYRYYRIDDKVIKFFPNGKYVIYIIR